MIGARIHIISSSSLSLLRSKPNIPRLLSLLVHNQTPPPDSTPDPANAAAAHIESCTSALHLPQIHTHVIRRHLLRTSFHWNSLARSYLRLARPRSALLLFTQMHFSAAAPDLYTLPIVLKASTQLFDLPAGRQLHCVSVKHGLDGNEYSESGLISFYAKFGDFDSARKVFDQNPHRKLGSWNAIINGLAQAGCSAESIEMFLELRRSGLVPDDVTMVSIASACGSLGDRELALQVHKCALQALHFGRLDVMLSNSLLDMYAKCGETELAYGIFSRMPLRDVSSWTAMIMGLATHGRERRAVEMFDEMRREGVRSNHVTMVGVLTACARGGLVDEGMALFEGIAEEHGLEPTVAHYGCVVDMLARVGRLAEARAMVESMPMSANAVIWGTLLGACEKHGDLGTGEWAAEKLMELEPWNDGVHVVLSNIYAGAGLWQEVERVRVLMRESRVAKAPGYSSAASAI